MKKTANMRPEALEVAYNSFRQKSHIINFDVVEREDGTFEYESAIIGPGQFDRDHIISAIVRCRYDQNRMEAIQNNYLLVIGSGQKNGAIEEEFRQMSSWRDMAKSIADRILE